LLAAGAPEHLAQIVTGYGDAGHALVTGIFFFKKKIPKNNLHFFFGKATQMYQAMGWPVLH